MLDLSADPIDFNLEQSARLLACMTKLGMSLEIELGVTGGEEDGVGADIEEGADNSLYTQPEDVLKAAGRPSARSATSQSPPTFGNVHGVYKPGNVKLRPEILKNSQAMVHAKANTKHAMPLDLVFHGGSGSEVEKIKEAVGYGVFKMNIDTDTQFAFAKPVGDYVKANLTAFEHQLDPQSGKPYKKVYDPRAWLRKGQQGMIARLQEAFEVLGSKGHSLAQ
ncbi:MAG: class II fructose-bisphosphate aldolase [Planctomycetota bacterium]